MKKTRGIIGIIAVIAFVGAFIYIFASNGTATRDEASVTPVTEGSSGGSSMYTLAEVATHKDASSCWTTINGGVYDLTNWINKHPGGPEAILSICGIDGSAAFNKQHGGQARPEAELATFKIGTLKK